MPFLCSDKNVPNACYMHRLLILCSGLRTFPSTLPIHTTYRVHILIYVSSSFHAFLKYFKFRSDVDFQTGKYSTFRFILQEVPAISKHVPDSQEAVNEREAVEDSS